MKRRNPITGFFLGIREFVAPRLKAGRVPFGRVVIGIQLLLALIFVGYTMSKMSVRMPFVSGEAYTIEVVFSDAQGLDEADGPGAAVAGSPVGRVTDVREENGRAIATLTLDGDMRGKIFSDASARVRPASALQNLLVNIDAGENTDEPLPDGARIEAGRTSGFVALDDLTSLLDADTQAMTQILIREAAVGLKDREPELRRSLAELGDLAETTTPIAEALADRRRLLRETVDHVDVVFTTLADRKSALAEGLDKVSQTLDVTARREVQLAEATRLLGGVLAETRKAIDATGRVARPLGPALSELTPVVDRLPDAGQSLIDVQATADGFLTETDALTKEAGKPVKLLVKGTQALRGKAIGLLDEVENLRVQSKLADTYKEGIPQFVDLWSGGLSVNDSGGVYAQIDNVAFEPARPENLGFPAAAARHRGKRPSQLNTALAKALDESCRSGSEGACLLRFNLPYLPTVSGTHGEVGPIAPGPGVEPLTSGAEKGGRG